MTYSIQGLDPASFSPLFALSDSDLAARGAVRVTATSDRGFPCRVSLEDARAGETLVLFNYLSHDVSTPYRNTYAIYVRAGAVSPAPFIDSLPPILATRQLSLRGFGDDGMKIVACLSAPEQHDATIRDLFADRRISYILAHNAAYGCFAARIERFEESAQ